MKRYSVVCHSNVENQLGELLLSHWGSPLAQQLSDSANRIDSELAVRPMEAGNQLPESPPHVRSLAVYPLAVDYAVNDDDRTVTLLRYHFSQPG